MKWLWMPLLWVAAMVVAVAVLYRFWSGRNVVLTGRWSPRFVRMVVVVLVVLGFGVEKSSAAPVPHRGAVDKPADPVQGDWPREMTPEVVGAWLAHQQSHSAWMSLKREVVKATLLGSVPEAEGLPPVGFGRFPIAANIPPSILKLAKVGHEESIGPEVALNRLDDMEKAGLFDHWAAALVWRSTKVSDDAKAMAELYARLHRHACLTNTLIQAQARVKPFLTTPRPWMSKAMAPKGYDPNQFDPVKSAGVMLPAAKELLPKSDAGTWLKDGVVVLAVERTSEPLTLIRAGTREIKPGDNFRLGRLDLVETPNKSVRVEHAWLGSIELPAGRVVAARSLPNYLADDAKTKVKHAVTEAMKGAEDPTTRLEKALPLAEQMLREALRQETDLPGAPRLRLILSLFDDAVMPALAPVEAPENPRPPEER